MDIFKTHLSGRKGGAHERLFRGNRTNPKRSVKDSDKSCTVSPTSSVVSAPRLVLRVVLGLSGRAKPVFIAVWLLYLGGRRNIRKVSLVAPKSDQQTAVRKVKSLK